MAAKELVPIKGFGASTHAPSGTIETIIRQLSATADAAQFIPDPLRVVGVHLRCKAGFRTQFHHFRAGQELVVIKVDVVQRAGVKGRNATVLLPEIHLAVRKRFQAFLRGELRGEGEISAYSSSREAFVAAERMPTKNTLVISPIDLVRLPKLAQSFKVMKRRSNNTAMHRAVDCMVGKLVRLPRTQRDKRVFSQAYVRIGDEVGGQDPTQGEVIFQVKTGDFSGPKGEVKIGKNARPVWFRSEVGSFQVPIEYSSPDRVVRRSWAKAHQPSADGS